MLFSFSTFALKFFFFFNFYLMFTNTMLSLLYQICTFNENVGKRLLKYERIEKQRYCNFLKIVLTCIKEFLVFLGIIKCNKKVTVTRKNRANYMRKCFERNGTFQYVIYI